MAEREADLEKPEAPTGELESPREECSTVEKTISKVTTASNSPPKSPDPDLPQTFQENVGTAPSEPLLSPEPSPYEQESPKQKVYTVDEAINKIGFGPFQILVTVFCGLLWLADAMEFMLLSVLSPAVKCQWDLSSFEEAFISSLVFFGFLLGGLFWGMVSDVVGRKTGLFIVNLVILVCAGLSAIPVSASDSRIPGYPWLLICRFGVGFGTGGTGQAITYYAEFLPLKGRGVFIVLIEVWWAIGTMFGGLLALAVLGEGGLGWHWLLGFATIPLALVIFMFPLVPESARFYLVKGKPDKAQKVLKRVAFCNCKEMLVGRVVSQEEKEKINAQESAVFYTEGNVSFSQTGSYNVTSDEEDAKSQSHEIGSDETPLLVENGPKVRVSETQATKPSKLKVFLDQLSSLFTNGMWKTTIILMCLWLGAAWLYYGIVLLTTSLLQYDPHCGADDILNSSNLTNESCEDSLLQKSDYLKILWTTAAELPGLLITVFIIEIFGRKITMAVEFVATMIGFLLLFICASDVLITLFLFIIRAFATGVFQAIYVYTPEVYATNSRAIGMGVCTAAARVGAIATPYVAQILLHANDYATLSLYAGSSLVLAILAMLLPIETKGRALRDEGK